MVPIIKRRLSKIIIAAGLLQFCSTPISAQENAASANQMDNVCHISITRTRADSVQGLRERNYELWAAPQKIFAKMKYSSEILRYDLNKEWKLSSNGQTYSEFPIVNTNDEEENNKNNELYDLGFRYDPVYTWDVTDTKTKVKIGNWQCSHYILHGDAECSERTIDIWITGEPPEYLSIINDENFHRIIYGDRYMNGLKEIFPLLKKGVIVLSSEVFRNYSGPDVKIETKITSCEVEKNNTTPFALPSNRLRVE
jgi:hypothetical protein